jgi:hypothetical protein
MRITKNLAHALRQLQTTHAPGQSFWIDALAIHQNSHVEKSHQITLMKDIFHTAVEVVIWLGPDEQRQGDDIFNSVEHLYDLMLSTIDQKRKLDDTQCWLPPEDAMQELKSLAPLFLNPYWSRSWTIQETGIATRSSVLWGTSSFDFRKICPAAMMFLKYFKTQAESVGVRRELELITNLYTMYLPSPGLRRLHYVLHEARPHRATDPRDKIYAFISHPAALDAMDDFPHQRRDGAKPATDQGRTLNDNLARILAPEEPSSQSSSQSHWARLITTDLNHELRPLSPDAFSAHRLLHATSDRLEGLHRYVEGRSFVQPDYSQSLVAVYQDVAVKMIEGTNSLEILSFVQHHCPLPTVGPDFPSWIPRWDTHWTVPILGRDTCDHFAAANRKPIISPSREPGVLIVRGLFFDRVQLHTITLTRQDFLDPSRTSPVFSMASHCRVDQDPLADYPRILNHIMANPDRSQAYCKTWVAGDSDTAWTFHKDNADFLAYQLEFVYRRMKQGKATAQDWQMCESLVARGATSGNATRYAERAARACDGRRFFITKAGFFGVGPSVMEQNDSVAVVLGLDVPVILREKEKVGHASDGWAVIGECYVEGIMCGETIRAWGGPDSDDLKDIKLR